MLIASCRLIVVVCAALFLGGCSQDLMPTPNIYLDPNVNAFEGVHQDLQSNACRLIYLTDRQPTGVVDGIPTYGTGRNKSLAFGQQTLRFGKNIDWPTLVKASRTDVRFLDLTIHYGKVRPRGTFPESPGKIELTEEGELRLVNNDKELAASEAEFQKLVCEHLSRTQLKHIFLFVHGYNNDFQYPSGVIAGLWHFMGRRGVPMVYLWPSKAKLLGYGYDRESGDFTIFHLKQMLRALGKCPEVEKLHIIAHSRGSDVVMTALREIYLEQGRDAIKTRKALKLGTLILAAPDLDIDVESQRVTAEGTQTIPEQMVVYVSAHDQALRFADWVVGSIKRLGQLEASDLGQNAKEMLMKSNRVQLIDARDVGVGEISHSYFYDHPAVSSDMIRILRDRAEPGVEHGRPLLREDGGFWRIDSNYGKPGHIPKRHSNLLGSEKP